jgi:hypothetical protein
VKREFTMPKTLSYAALAAAVAIAGPAFAQATSPTKEAAPQTAAPQSAVPPLTAGQAPAAATPPTAAAPSAAPPASSAPAPGATAPTGTDAAANAGASTTLMSGMSVKDNTGALIGEVKSVKGGIATIQMGSDSFTVDTNKLGVSGGAANINASQAELKKMLPAKK